MSKGSEAVKRWRERTKARMIEAMGGKCCVCDYNKSQRAMDFHHLDPSEKEIGLGNARGTPVAWKKIVEELRKCVLVCNRCHQEIHDGVTEVPQDAPKFNEAYAEYRETKTIPCPVCGTEMGAHKITCSRACAAKKSGKVDWEAVDLPELMTRLSIVKIADMLGVSDAAVRKRLKKIDV